MESNRHWKLTESDVRQLARLAGAPVPVVAVPTGVLDRALRTLDAALAAVPGCPDCHDIQPESCWRCRGRVA